jgi:3-hydroxyacyl-[acyl-carrier-protein] dehydratase
MRFHLVDRIDSWSPNRWISGRKVTSGAEDFWPPTADAPTANAPVLPSPLVLEALCQAGSWLVLLSTGHRKRAALLSLGEVSFHGDVEPGAVLLLDAEITSVSADAAVLDGTVRVAGDPTTGPDRTVLTATGIMCALIDAEQLDDPAATRRMGDQLVRSGPDGSHGHRHHVRADRRGATRRPGGHPTDDEQMVRSGPDRSHPHRHHLRPDRREQLDDPTATQPMGDQLVRSG